jgi:hypothetical protein
MDYSRIYAAFDPAKPSMLLYAGDDQTSPVVGVSYYVYSSTLRPPEGFPGLLDKWHRHPEVCVDRHGAHRSEGQGIVVCGHRGRNAWMLHVWVVPGYESIEGTFSARNLKLH